MTLAELIAAKRASGVATPESAEAAGIPEPSRTRMGREPLTVHGHPWLPKPDIVAKIAMWLGEPVDVVVAAIRESHEGATPMTTTVTATDGTSSESHDVEDNYVVTTDGTAYVHGVQVHWLKDGTSTHTITVKGIR